MRAALGRPPTPEGEPTIRESVVERTNEPLVPVTVTV